MRNKRTESAAHGRLIRLLGVLLLGAGLAACGGDNGGGGGGTDAQLQPDTGSDADQVDAGGDVDPQNDVGVDAEADTGPPDDDGDGVANAEDNCPEEPNAEQLDRDRDGIGDACDNLPAIHDPTNPDSFEATAEDEENIPNDDANAGEAYGLDLPFAVEGNVGPLDAGDADWDYYSFEVSEPTLLLVELDPDSSAYWPGGVLFGYDFRNGNVQRFILGDQDGQSHYREIFLPVPGKYSLVITDARNLLNAPNVGGSDYNYNVTLSAVPMPEPQPVTLPSAPIEREVDRTVHVYEVDVADVDALTSAATGVQLGENSVVLPMLSIYDPAEKRTMALTSTGQVSTQTAKASLTSDLGGLDTVWVVQDFWQRFGNNKTLLELGTTTVDSEFETLQQAQNERADKLVWTQPNTTFSAMIGPPRAVSGTDLEPDVDYFLGSVLPGHEVTVTITPGDSSQMQPEFDFGHLYEGQNESDFIWDEGGPDADNPGEAVSQSHFYDRENAGEIAIRVREETNRNSSNPVGGPGYEYDISVQIEEPAGEMLDSLPAAKTGTLEEPNQAKYYRLPVTAGERYYVYYRTNDFWSPITVYDTADYTKVGDGAAYRNGREYAFRAEEDGEYLIRVAVSDQSNGPDATYELFVEQVSATDIGSAPIDQQDVLEADEAPFPDWYKVSVTAGTAYQAALNWDDTLDLKARTRVYRGEDMERLGGGKNARWFSPEDGEVYIAVIDADHRGDSTYQYQLTGDVITSTALPLDTPTTGQLADGSEQLIYTFTAPAGGFEASVESDGSWEPKMRLTLAENLKPVEDVDVYEGRAYYAASSETEYALLISSRDGELAGPLDFTVNVTTYSPSAAIADTEPNDSVEEGQALGTPPVVIQGDLDENAGDERDSFTLELTAGQRLWVIGSLDPSLPLDRNFDTDVRIYRPDGSRAARDWDDGEFDMPAVHALEVDATGTWEIRKRLEWSSSEGNYLLYVFTTPAP